MVSEHYISADRPKPTTRAPSQVSDIIAKLKRKRDEEVASEKVGEHKREVGKKRSKRRESGIEAENTETTPEIIEKKKKEKSRVKEGDKGEKKGKKFKKLRTEIDPPEQIEEAVDEPEKEPETAQTPFDRKKCDKKRKKSKPDSANDSDDALSKHKSIRQKLSKIRVKSLEPTLTAESLTAEDEAIPVIPVGLEPLPQPAPTKTQKYSTTLASSLPPWLASPVVVTPTTTVPFISMPGLSPKILSRLDILQLPYAFAVQTAVIPLLLKDGGDVCISAATGSGKTLSYILPIVQSLSIRVVTRLRAVVVVPTRELVSQVFSTASSLSSGSGIKVGTAVGSRALVAEQGLLVGVGNDNTTHSKVDILITTPGRLVEHIKSTPGFSLHWVKWLVIDEADRLLAQSFQEWVDVVIGDFEHVTSGLLEEGDMGTVLEDLGIRINGRSEVRKVVLSATMTRDAGKLAGLKLQRPTMVVVENAAKSGLPVEKDEKTQGDNRDEKQEDDDDDMPDEIFSVPMELREYAVSVVNTEYKPLHLMYLLRDQGIKAGTVVFVKSNEGAARLARLIDTVVEGVGGLDKATGWTTGLITGEMEKKRRDKVLKAFKRGEVHM